jgi:hypothetical protein
MPNAAAGKIKVTQVLDPRTEGGYVDAGYQSFADSRGGWFFFFPHAFSI